VGQLDIQRDLHDGVVVVSATGDVETGTVGELAGQLRDGRRVAAATDRRLLVLDLERVKYFGSAGLSAVLDCHEQAGAEGILVRIAATTAEVRRPIEVTRLDQVLHLYDSVPAATDDDAADR
jgi:anti-anti-sigma factor